MIRLKLCAVILLSFCVPSFALELYVAPDGHDTNPGTKARPFATVSRAHSKSLFDSVFTLRMFSCLWLSFPC